MEIEFANKESAIRRVSLHVDIDTYSMGLTLHWGFIKILNR